MNILLATVAWFYLVTHVGNEPMIGPMTKRDCHSLKMIRAKLGSPDDICIPARPME